MNHSLPNRYSAKARHFHWTLAALIALAYALILSTDIFPRNTGIPAFLLQSHFWAGIGVFLLAFGFCFSGFFSFPFHNFITNFFPGLSVLCVFKCTGI